MASFASMLGWREPDAGAHDRRATLRRHFHWLAERRGVQPWFDRFESHRIVREGPHLHLDVLERAPDAPVVVFAPGTNAYGLLYGPFLVGLSERGFNVVAYDPRGHGQSGGARGSYTVGELVADLWAVVRWASDRWPGPIHVAGSSQGGIAAFYLAAEPGASRHVASVICHNLADLADPASACLTRAPFMARLARPAIAATARLWPGLPVPMAAYLDLRREPVQGFGSAAEVMRIDPLTVPFVRLRTLASLAMAPLPRSIEEVRVPVLVLQAGADTIFPTDYVRSLYDRLRCEKELALYPGLPHYLIVDHVDAVVPDVAAWIERTSVRRSAGAA